VHFLKLAAAALSFAMFAGAVTAQPPPADTATPSTAKTPAPALAVAAPDATASAAAKGGFITVDVPSPPDGKGEVVFFRKRDPLGSAVWFNVRENGGEQLGKLTNGVYFVVSADPGPHTYTAATENTDNVRLVVAPGETYFVEGTITTGVFIGHANLNPSDRASFDKVSQKLKLSPTPGH
jgi:hypothetical protein